MSEFWMNDLVWRHSCPVGWDSFDFPLGADLRGVAEEKRSRHPGSRGLVQGGEPKWAWCLCSCTQRKVRSNEGLGSGRTATGLEPDADGVRVSLGPGTVSVRVC